MFPIGQTVADTSSINAAATFPQARSPDAVVYVYQKFSTKVEFETIQRFEAALRDFVKDRPRQWANFAGFRPTRIETELGYIGKCRL